MAKFQLALSLAINCCAIASLDATGDGAGFCAAAWQVAESARAAVKVSGIKTRAIRFMCEIRWFVVRLE
jgi:hypothetical protein